MPKYEEATMKTYQVPITVQVTATSKQEALVKFVSAVKRGKFTFSFIIPTEDEVKEDAEV